MIQAEVDVVKVHAAGHLRVRGDFRARRGHHLFSQIHDILCCLLSLHEEDRQMLSDGLLHSADVLSGDPILPGSAHKVLRTWASLGPVALCLARLLRASGSQFLEEVRHLHHKHRAVVRVDPRLAVKPLHVVAATHRGWDQFVVFLQDLVARRGVEVCKLLDPQEFALHLVEGVPQMGNPLHSLRVACTVATLLGVSQHARHVGALRSARPRICRGSVRGELRQTSPTFDDRFERRSAREGGWWLTGRG